MSAPFLGVGAAFAAMRFLVSDTAAPRKDVPAAVVAQAPADSGLLAQLSLDAAQREQIERLRERERGKIDALQRAYAEVEQDLRRAELAQPFDAERVGALVVRQAELTAYLRGAESRAVSEIARLLTPEQQRHFAELRTAGATAAPRAREIPDPTQRSVDL